MCSLNSIVQLLRHIPEFVNQLNNWNHISDITNSLIYIFSQQGSESPVSAIRLRQHLANTTGNDLNSGEQQDTIELLGFLLEHCPNNLFVFEAVSEYRFKVNGQPSPCPDCHQYPPSVSTPDTFLRLAIPGSWDRKLPPLTLQTVLNRHFRVSEQGIRNCPFTDCAASLPVMERFHITKHPEYLFIQLVRMQFVGNTTVKNTIAVQLPDTVTIDNEGYEVVGTVTHLGLPAAGHNRAYKKIGSSWYRFEDAKPILQKEPIDCENEQNYCLLLKRLKGCHVLLEPLTNLQKPHKDSRQPVSQSKPDSCGADLKETYLKRTLSNESISSQGSAAKIEKRSSQCEGCGKTFSLLFSHLSRSTGCQEQYDMELMRKEIE